MEFVKVATVPQQLKVAVKTRATRLSIYSSRPCFEFLSLYVKGTNSDFLSKDLHQVNGYSRRRLQDDLFKTRCQLTKRY